MWSSLRPCFLKIIKDLRKPRLFLKFLLFSESHFSMKKGNSFQAATRTYFHILHFIIQIKCDKCLTAVSTEPSSIYEFLPTKALWQHSLSLRISSMSGEYFFLFILNQEQWKHMVLKTRKYKTKLNKEALSAESHCTLDRKTISYCAYFQLESMKKYISLDTN